MKHAIAMLLVLAALVSAAGFAEETDAVFDTEVPATQFDTTVEVDSPTGNALDTDTEAAVVAENEEHDRYELDFFVRLGITLVIVAGQALLIWLIWAKFFKFLSNKIAESCKGRIKPFRIHKLKLLNPSQVINLIRIGLNALKYLVTALQLYITLPLVFSMFSATRHIAARLFGYILNPLHNILFGTIGYIPNLITIVIIATVTRYVLKGLKFFVVQIENGKLVIPNFYADWAKPTYKILQVLLWAFTVAIAYPYLPGSDSRVFQGVSVFVGIVFSLGSSSAIGNLVAGLVVTYMRPFKIGDRIKINDTVGFVVEKHMMVVRIRTHKNEYVTFPNMLLLNSSVTNYNTSSDENAEGLIIHTEVTIGYATPWQTVHEILIKAALATNYVQKKPLPFVLQTGFDDFYARYQINCYTKEIDKVPRVYTLLNENIQSAFQEAGIDMTSAHQYKVESLVESSKDPKGDPNPTANTA
ncbi:MAG: mechanosensitive ion channel family protein [Treponema sp.]|nr:mechanosensitive ion channel family protein [Treponema sp.]